MRIWPLASITSSAGPVTSSAEPMASMRLSRMRILALCSSVSLSSKVAMTAALRIRVVGISFALSRRLGLQWHENKYASLGRYGLDTTVAPQTSNTGSAAAIGTVTIRRHQQRHMIMLVSMGNTKAQHHLIHERWLILGRTLARKVRTHGEHQLILAGAKGLGAHQRLVTATVGIRYHLLEYRRRAVLDTFDGNVDTGRRTAIGSIEYMCREITHNDFPVIV